MRQKHTGPFAPTWAVRSAPAAQGEHHPAPRAVKRAAPPARRERPGKPRSDADGEETNLTDNPDPWAPDQGVSENTPEGSR